MTRKIERLEMLLGGIRNMAQVPELLFVVDVRREDTSIHEANLLEIPIVAMVDTNCDPRNIDFIIPSNDDAIRAIKLVVGKVADAVLEGQAMRKDEEAEMPKGFMEYPSDADLSDEDLLGAATLAKLQTQRDEDAEASEEFEDDIDVDDAEVDSEQEEETDSEAEDETLDEDDQELLDEDEE